MNQGRKRIEIKASISPRIDPHSISIPTAMAAAGFSTLERPGGWGSLPYSSRSRPESDSSSSSSSNSKAAFFGAMSIHRGQGPSRLVIGSQSHYPQASTTTMGRMRMAVEGAGAGWGCGSSRSRGLGMGAAASAAVAGRYDANQRG